MRFESSTSKETEPERNPQKTFFEKRIKQSSSETEPPMTSPECLLLLSDLEQMWDLMRKNCSKETQREQNLVIKVKTGIVCFFCKKNCESNFPKFANPFDIQIFVIFFFFSQKELLETIDALTAENVRVKVCFFVRKCFYKFFFLKERHDTSSSVEFDDMGKLFI